jgi:nucleoside-diphosphate-sugar epimerase
MHVRAGNVLIANTKSGGHAFIGYHLAEALLKDGHKVTILNDGDQEKVSKKEPYSLYPNLEKQGVRVVWGDPQAASAAPSEEFDVVYDNNGKKLETCQPLIDKYKDNVKHYVFVGSAGAYEANPIEPLHVEGDKRKSSAGHVEVEKYLESSGTPFTVFQPQYIYGPYTAKDCEQWFVDRIIRDRPVPIPAPGIQLVNLTHVEDVASMMAKVPGNSAAVGQHYNVVSERYITFDGIVRAIASALGKEAKIVHYDPAKAGLKKGEGFPFRTGHFFASAEKAKRELGWSAQHSFLGDVDALVKAYKDSGRESKDIDFSIDDKILSSV